MADGGQAALSEHEWGLLRPAAGQLSTAPAACTVLYTVHSTVLYSWVYCTQADRKLQLVWSGGARVYSDLSYTSFEIWLREADVKTPKLCSRNATVSYLFSQTWLNENQNCFQQRIIIESINNKGQTFLIYDCFVGMPSQTFFYLWLLNLNTTNITNVHAQNIVTTTAL